MKKNKPPNRRHSRSKKIHNVEKGRRVTIRPEYRAEPDLRLLARALLEVVIEEIKRQRKVSR